MRTVYIDSRDNKTSAAISVHLSSLVTNYVTATSYNAEQFLRTNPLWRMMIKRGIPLLSPRIEDFEALAARDRIDFIYNAYPKVKVEVDDEVLTEMLLLKSPDDELIY